MSDDEMKPCSVFLLDYYYRFSSFFLFLFFYPFSVSFFVFLFLDKALLHDMVLESIYLASY